MKTTKKVIMPILLALTILALLAFAYYALSQPNSPYAPLGFLVIFGIDIAVWALFDVFGNGKESN